MHHGIGHMVWGRWSCPGRGEVVLSRGRGAIHPPPPDRTTSPSPQTGPPLTPRKERSLTTPPPPPQEGKVIDPQPPNPQPPPPPLHTGTPVYAQAGGTHPTGMHSCFCVDRLVSSMHICRLIFLAVAQCWKIFDIAKESLSELRINRNYYFSTKVCR